MLLYGDPEFQIEAQLALKKIREIFNATTSGDLNDARNVLIALGELEQGVADAGLPTGRVEGLTNLAADLFLNIYNGNFSKRAHCVLKERLNAGMELPEELRIRVKIPEGYAFYSLYPDQYISSAERWLAKDYSEFVLVIGVRSIGTSLSAVVHSVLKHHGRHSKRITVRPTGHAYNREILLPEQLGEFEAVIIVDEGPGQSGSSMASVARSAKERGYRKVIFFPGHANEPGASVSEAVRKIWVETSRVSTPLEAVCWGEQTLTDKLKIETGELLGAHHVAQVNNPFENCKCGNEHEFLELRTPQFDRTGFLFKNEMGVHWKYAGLGSGKDFELIARRNFFRQRKLFEESFAPEPLALIDGFIGMRWIEGRPLKPDDLDEGMLERLTDYIMAVAIPSQSSNDADLVKRLRQIVSVNFEETFDGGIAEKGAALIGNLNGVSHWQYGDGRVAPHKWIKADTGKIYKTDCWGHDLDHTCIGEQSVLWDVAGSVIEWQMSEQQVGAFIDLFASRNLAVGYDELRGYMLAYVAFRLGVLRFSGNASLKVENWLKAIALNLLNNSWAFDGRTGHREGADHNEGEKNGISLEGEIELRVQ
jgi:hypothetical protein